MTEISQRAREILAAEFEAAAAFHDTPLIHDAADLRKGKLNNRRTLAALRAIERALKEPKS